jgi:multidrug efflux pump
MSFTSYFIKHPVVTLILNSMLVGIGYLAFDMLKVREYPEVTFPEATVLTFYPSASPEVIENTITNPLEDRFAGLENLETITSEMLNLRSLRRFSLY